MFAARAMIPSLLALVLLAAACGVLGDDGEPYPLATQEPAPRGAGGLGALVMGELAIDLDRGCVWLLLEGRRYPAVWPAGSTAERDPFVITLPDGATVRPGELVRGGGGYLPNRGAAIPEDCVEEGEVAFFNPNEVVVVEPSE